MKYFSLDQSDGLMDIVVAEALHHMAVDVVSMSPNLRIMGSKSVIGILLSRNKIRLILF